jgi:hypothetical protein
MSWTELSFFIVQHYTELSDIKRVIVNTHAIEPQVWNWNAYTLLVKCEYGKFSNRLVLFSLLLSSLEPFPKNGLLSA